MACTWLFTWPGTGEQEFEEEFFDGEHVNYDAFPVRMPIGLRQRTSILLTDEDFCCLCFILCSVLEALSM